MSTKTINILVAGDKKVGKTSVIKTFVKDECRQEYSADMHSTMQSTRITLEGVVYKVNFYDGSSDKASFQDKDIYFLMYGINDQKTFDNVNKNYLSKISKKSKNGGVLFLVGNKLDRCVDINQYGFNAREVGEQDAKQFADKNDCQFAEICATTKKNTHSLWNDALRHYQYLQTHPKNGGKSDDKPQQAGNEGNSNDGDGCCVIM